jgi:hypothetical protein
MVMQTRSLAIFVVKNKFEILHCAARRTSEAAQIAERLTAANVQSTTAI